MSIKSGSSSALALDTNPESFFFELVHGAVQNQHVKIQPETEFYLVRLLNRFIFSESLYSKNSDGTLEDQPLVFLFKEALEAEATTEQKMLFQNVGDISLYKAGFFQESLHQASVDLDYYIGLGGSAYLNAAQRTGEKNNKIVFSELSDQFGRFVNVLLEVSENTILPQTEQNIFRLYELWERTGSERAARALKKAGIKIQE